jgi:hypothetical protein
LKKSSETGSCACIGTGTRAKTKAMNRKADLGRTGQGLNEYDISIPLG